MRRPNLTPPRPVSSEPRAVGTRARGADLSLPEPPSFRAVRNTALALAVLVLGGMFVGAPYRSADRLGKAIESGDPARLEEVIDFPALREDLKAQMMTALGAEGEAGESPIALAGAAFASGLIDTVVRPEMVAKAKDAPIDPDLKARLKLAMRRARVGYDGPLTFSVRVVMADVSDEPLRVTMRRSGPFTWKVTGISLPKDLSKLQQLEAEPELPPGIEKIGPGRYRTVVRAD